MFIKQLFVNLKILELLHWLCREHIPHIKSPSLKVNIKTIERGAVQGTQEWFVFRGELIDKTTVIMFFLEYTLQLVQILVGLSNAYELES